MKVWLRRVPAAVWAFFFNLLIALIAVCPFIIRDHGLFAMFFDFSAQEIPFHIFINEAVKSGEYLWNWAIDLGGNFLESYSFYNLGSFFTWIEFLFPPEKMPYVMGWMIILKFAAAGGISAAYLKRHLKSLPAVLIASALYTFSGFQCCSIVFYHFQDQVALFPLLMIGLEELVEENKKGRFAFYCFLNVLCNYVFFVGEVIFLVIYYIVYYLVPRFQKERKAVYTEILMCAVEGLIGIMLAGVLLVPSVHGTVTNSRVSDHILGQSWFSMSTADWLFLIKAFLLPAEPMGRYSSVYGINWLSKSAYLPLFGIVFVTAYMMKRKDRLSAVFKTFGVIAVIPLLNNMFMFFSREGYCRWYYMLILLMAMATAEVLEQPSEYPVFKSALVSLGALAVFVIMTYVVRWSEEERNVVFRPAKYWIGIAVAIAGILAVTAVVYLMKRWYMQLLFAGTAAACAGIMFYSVWMYQNTLDNTGIDFREFSKEYAENVVAYLTEISGGLSRDVLPYRYCFDEGVGLTYYNLALGNSLPSVNSFLSTVHSSVTDFYAGLGSKRFNATPVAFAGPRELLGARYVYSRVENPDYVYKGVRTTSAGIALLEYENERALPIGFTQDCYIKKSEFLNYPWEKRPLIMLSALVVEDGDAEAVASVIPHITEEKLEFAVEDNLTEIAESHMHELGQEFEKGINCFSETIVAGADKYAFFSVPYDKFWHARVNGAEAEILNVNGLMALKISGGANRIEFTYRYPLLKFGALLSAAGIACYAVYLGAAVTKKKKGQ